MMGDVECEGHRLTNWNQVFFTRSVRRLTSLLSLCAKLG